MEGSYLTQHWKNLSFYLHTSSSSLSLSSKKQEREREREISIVILGESVVAYCF